MISRQSIFLILAVIAGALVAGCCDPACGSDLIDATHEATCRVRAGSGVGSGTCFLVGDNGDAFFLTNHHVAGKKNSNVKIELWRNGQLQPPVNGRVVLAVITNGYFDGAVVRVASADLERFGTQSFIPISLPSDPQPDYKTILSRGCPGGTWQTQFVGSVFDKNPSVIRFYPRPGGGRSGSSVIDPATGKIVALITWSSGKPSHEQHGVDGVTNQSGHGIAQNRDTIWAILQNQVPTSVLERPADEVPLLFQDENFKVDPDEYEARLRRLREREREQQNPPSDGERILPDRPRLLPGGRLGANLFSFIARLVILVAVVAFVAFVGYRLLKKWGVLVLVIGFGLWADQSHAQETYQGAMRGLAERWSADAVSEPSVWMAPNEAIREAALSGSSLVVLLTTDNCDPCEKLKADLECLADLTYLNHSFLTRINASETEHAATVNKMLPPELQTNRSYPILIVYSCQQNEDGSRTWVRHVCKGYAFAENDSAATEARPTLLTYLERLGVR